MSLDAKLKKSENENKVENAKFTYNYSAERNCEILQIREKYIVSEESKIEEIKRLDRIVRYSGVSLSLTIGILSCLLFGIGMCMALNFLEGSIALEIIAEAVGVVGMIVAYPIYLFASSKAKVKYAPRILQLADEICKK